MNGEAGKGDTYRPILCSQEEWGLRWDLATGKITREKFDEEMEKLHGEHKVQ